MPAQSIESYHLNIYRFLGKYDTTKIADTYKAKHELLILVSTSIDKIKIGMFNRLQEVFFYLYNGYKSKQSDPQIICIDNAIPAKNSLIKNFALKFEGFFNDVDKVFISSFKIRDYEYANQGIKENTDAGGIRRVAISDLASCYGSKGEGFDDETIRIAFPKLIWFLLANMFKPDNTSLLKQSWKVKYDGFSTLVNLPIPFWGCLLSQSLTSMSDDDATKVFDELGMTGTTLENLKSVIATASNTDEEIIDGLNDYFTKKLSKQDVLEIKSNKILSFKDKIKDMLSRYLNSKYHIGELRREFWQDDKLEKLRSNAQIDESVLLSTGAFLEDNNIENYLKNGNVQFLLMRMFLKELNAQQLFNMFNNPPTSQEIKKMILEGIKNKINEPNQENYFPSEVKTEIGKGTLSEKGIRDLFEKKQVDLQNNIDNFELIERLKAIVWTFDFINENSDNEKNQMDTRSKFVTSITGETHPEYIGIELYEHKDIYPHTCFKRLDIPPSLLEDYELFKATLSTLGN